jgi:hypothetical protein
MDVSADGRDISATNRKREIDIQYIIIIIHLGGIVVCSIR